MISKMLLLDSIKNKKNLVLKFLIPLVIVSASFQVGYGNITLVMLLIFAVITGAGLKIVKLKTSGVYKRLLISPIKKRDLFFEITIVTSFLYFLQFIPALLVAAFYESPLIILYALIAIMIVVFIGILTGIHAQGFGEIHLYSILLFIPLIGFTMINSDISLVFPFIAIVHSKYTIFTLIIPCLTLFFLSLLLLVDVHRL
jgi:hypothetical protein